MLSIFGAFWERYWSVRTILTSRELLCAVGACLLLLGCHHAAVRRDVQAPNELPSIAPKTLFEIGLLHAEQGDLLRAEQYLIAARGRGYDGPTVAYWLVRVCVAAGRYQSALDHASRHLRDNPSYWRLRLVVASLHEALGDHQRARLELEHIVKTQPTMPLPHYRLAMLYSQQPAWIQGAALHFQAYLDLDPDGAHAPEVQTLLEHSRNLALEPNNRQVALSVSQNEALP